MKQATLAPESVRSALLHEVLGRHAVSRPGAPCVTFLAAGEQIQAQRSFAELNTRARAVAAQLSRIAAVGDRVLLAFVIYAFTVDIFLAGTGVTLQVSHAKTVISDADHGSASRELVGRLVEPSFSVQSGSISQNQALDALDRGDAMMAVDIPPNFTEDLAAGRDTTVGLWVDTSNSVQGFLAASYMTRVVTQFGLESGIHGHTLLTVQRVLDPG